MPKSRPLQVKPVKRYREARYPSHLDPDPTLHPQPVPYPLGKPFLAAAATLGLAMASSRGSAEEEGQEAAPQGPHPLTVAQSGLPYQSSPYGTGAPTPLDEKLARRIIDRAFKDAGFSLQSDFAYEKDGVAFTADGYDPKAKAGYVIVTWSKMEGDALVDWRPKGTAADIEAAQHALSPELAKRVQEAKALADPEAREKALKEILQAHDKTRISLTEAKKLEARADANKEYIAVINSFDRRFEYNRWSVDKELAAERKKAEEIPDPAKREIAVRAIEERIARKALQNLEKAVREYLAWVRKQGAP